MRVHIFSIMMIGLLCLTGCSDPRPVPSVPSTPPQVASYIVSPPSALAIEELEKRLHQIEFFEKHPEIFNVPEQERRVILEKLGDAKSDIAKKEYAAAWRKLTGSACQTFAGLKVVKHGNVQYATNSFSEFGIFRRGQLLLTGMSISVTVRHAPDIILYYTSDKHPDWAPGFIGETKETTRSFFEWGPYLRGNSFPFSMRTSVDAQSVLWRVRCSSTQNSVHRPGWKNWFSLTFHGNSEFLWDCPITIVNLQGERKEVNVPALSSPEPWSKRFEKTASIVFHRPDGDISLSIKPETDQSPGFSGLTATADKAKKEWEFNVGWEIPEKSEPKEYRADFDMQIQLE